MRARSLVIVAAPLFALGACQLFVSFDDPGSAGVDAGSTDAGSDATGPTSDSGDPCIHRVPPPPPAAPSDGGLDDKAFLTFGVKAIRFLPPTGWDLDGLCTGDKGSPTAGSPCNPVDGGTVLVDFDGGVDDAFGFIASGLTFGNMDPVATAVNIRIDQGETLLFALTGYNGGANDDYVQLAATRSHNVQTVVYPGTSKELDGSAAEGGLLHPVWDGNDHWGVPTNVVTVTTASGEVVPTILFVGYVVNHVLVVRPTQPIAVPLGADVDMHDPWITATIDLGGAMPVLRNGIIAGRVSPDQLLPAVGHFDLYTSPGNPVPLCDPTNQGLYRMLASQLCVAPDIALDHARDGKGMTCDGISVAMGFEAWKAHLGDKGLDGTPEVCAPGTLLTSCNADMDAGTDADAN